LDNSTLEMVKNGDISVGHAKILVGVEDVALRQDLALKVKRDTLTVRNLEELLKTLSKPKPEVKVKKKDVYFKEIELSLAETTGRKVNVNGKNGKGKLEIEFYSNEDLAEIAKLLAKLNG
ncbi:MAG: stage 0 sporulation protein J, partial [Oscillospiraceae bacterium]|nr:stage 0 sporulation protein J [Oscillospiraceae bacterium]